MRWYHSYSGIVTGPAIMRRVNSKSGGQLIEGKGQQGRLRGYGRA